MGRLALAVVFGVSACLVAFMAAAVVEVPGQNPPQERIVAGVAAFLFLAACRFLLARRDGRRSAANWPIALALGVPMLVVASVADARNLGERVVLYGPWVAAGCLGIAAGAVLAARVTLSPLPLSSCRRSARSCAVVLAAVALVLVAVVVPLTRMAGTFPDGAPGAAAAVFLVIAGLSALAAADLTLLASRAGRGRPPSFGGLGSLALLAFVPACFLVIPAGWFVGHGPVLRAVSVVSPLCALAQFAVAARLGAAALRLPEPGTA